MMGCSVIQEASTSHHDFKNLYMYLLDFKLHGPNFMITRYVSLRMGSRITMKCNQKRLKLYYTTKQMIFDS